MRSPPRRRRHFAPTMHQRPSDEPARSRLIAKVSGERTQKKPDILVEGIELVSERVATAEQVAANLAIHFQDKGGLRLVICVIGGEKIREQLAIFIDGIDRLAQEAG